MADHYDVVIVGGGMVGLTAACALGNSDLRVAVLEAAEIETHWPESDIGLRVSAITHASRNIFDAVGAWQSMVERRLTAYSDMHVWDANGDGQIHFDSTEVGAPTLGYIIENRIIQAALYEQAQRLANVDVLCGRRWQQWFDCGGELHLRLDDGQTLRTRLLVGADGARSPVRERAGIKTQGWGYDQSAVMAIVQTEQPHQHTCWQRFLDHGPLAFLPMHDNHSCVVWSTSPEEAKTLLADDDEGFRLKLGQAFDHTLGAITRVGPRGAFPLRLQHTLDYVKERIALIGDAAHAIHPLAGQGVNLGTLDAAALAETILDAHARGRDIGLLTTLRKYERSRKGQNIAMMLSMDGFKRVFGNQTAPLQWARNTGLKLTDHLPPVKHLLMEYAMGERNDLPKLATPQLTT